MTSIGTHPIHVDSADVQFYNENGYFIYQNPLFPIEKFQQLKKFFEDLFNNLTPDKRPEAMDVPHFEHPELLEWLLAEEVLNFVAHFLGSDIALWSSHFICKPPTDGKRVP